MKKQFISSRFEFVDSLTLKDDGNVKTFTSKSSMFQYLYENQVSIADIQRFTNCHYSFVYGVISSKNENVRHEKSTSKSDEIRQLFDTGLTVGLIAKQLNSNYSFVFGVVKKYKEKKEMA